MPIHIVLYSMYRERAVIYTDMIKDYFDDVTNLRCAAEVRNIYDTHAHKHAHAHAHAQALTHAHTHTHTHAHTHAHTHTHNSIANLT
jgi:hypothetical protein